MLAKIVVFGDDQAIFKMERSGEAATETVSVMDRILEDMFRVEEQVFKSQGRRGGGSWKRLKPETAKRKKSDRILVESGELLESVTVLGAPYQDVAVSNTLIEFGTTRPGAVAHQFGSEIAGVPARPFIRFTFYDLERWAGWLEGHVMFPWFE